MNKVTIDDIARIAGVSKSTVSRVLNNTAVVNPEKQKAVKEAIERLGFKPNLVASSLARGRSMAIGVLTQIMGSPFYDAISQGVVAGLSNTGYSPIFADGQWQEGEEVDAIRALLGRQVDGLVLIGGNVPAASLLELCGSLPTVLAARRIESDSYRWIALDNIEGSYLATKHLIENGHRDIVTISGLANQTDAQDRLTGYRKAMEEAGIPVRPEMILPGDFSARTSKTLIEALISSGKPFTGIVAANDLSAFGARLALHEHQIRVPEDVSLVGFDDQLESSYTTPPLTTIHQPAVEMGIDAAKMLLALIQDESCESKLVQGELMVRKSVQAID